jgi:cellulose biosynthesis protein BcsQ
LTTLGLIASQGVLIPLQCETLSHRGVGQLLDTIYDVKKFTNRRLEVIGVLPTLFDGRTTHGRTVLERIGDDYGVTVPLRYRNPSDSPRRQQSAGLSFAPPGRARVQWRTGS